MCKRSGWDCDKEGVEWGIALARHLDCGSFAGKTKVSLKEPTKNREA